jgi:hypothetical protein
MLSAVMIQPGEEKGRTSVSKPEKFRDGKSAVTGKNDHRDQPAEYK